MVDITNQNDSVKFSRHLTFPCLIFSKAATQIDNAVLPVPPAKTEAATEAAEIAIIKVEETLDVIGADIGDVILASETADV